MLEGMLKFRCEVDDRVCFAVIRMSCCYVCVELPVESYEERPIGGIGIKTLLDTSTIRSRLPKGIMKSDLSCIMLQNIENLHNPGKHQSEAMTITASFRDHVASLLRHINSIPYIRIVHI